MDQEQQNMTNLIKFFEADSKIKQILMDIAPEDGDEYDEEARMKKLDKMYKSFGDISSMLQDCGNFANSSVKVQEIRQKFIEIAYGKSKATLQDIYVKYFTNLSEEVINAAGTENKGYYILSNPWGVVDRCQTVNELLHAVHSGIVNNEKILQNLPVVEKKENNVDAFTLYGNSQNEEAKSIFDKIDPQNTRMGETQIVAVSDRKTIMMVRDCGHALTLDITRTEKGEIEVNYFVPKICNFEMARKLKGVNKITDSSKFARGSFNLMSDEDVGNLIVGFIHTIPRDEDMERYTNTVEETQNEETDTAMEALNEQKEEQLQEKNNPEINLWMNRFRGWSNCINRATGNLRVQLVNIKSGISQAIRGKIKAGEKQNTNDKGEI